MLARVLGPGGGQRKKLEEAARLWARGDLVSQESDDAQARDTAEELNADAAGLGIFIEEEPVLSEAEFFYLWPENVPVWMFYHRCCATQWRQGQEGKTGLDYGVVMALIRKERPRARRGLFELVQAIERGLLRGWAEWRAEHQHHE